MNLRDGARQLRVNSYVIMPTHLHATVFDRAFDPQQLKHTLDDMRKFTGRQQHKNITSKPHDEVIQVKHKPFDEKVWLGLTELLSDPENMKAQLEKRLHAQRAKLPSSQSADEYDKELNQLASQEKRILDAYREEVINLLDLKEQKAKISSRRKVLETKKKGVLSQPESLGQPKITMTMLGTFQPVLAVP